MTVYMILEALSLAEADKAKQFADQYLSRLKEGNPEAEVSSKLSRDCFRNATALQMAIRELPVEVAGQEVEI